jgi:hypothetical protein
MYNWFFWTTWTILIPAVICIIKFKQIPGELKPLVFLLWVGVVTEVVAAKVKSDIGNNQHVLNVYMLAEFFLTTWLFYKWQAFERMAKWVLYVAASLYTLLWIGDNLLLNDLSKVNILFRMVYSVTLALLGINQLSRIYITGNNGYRWRNPYLYICLAIVFYHTYSAFISLISDSSLFGPSPALWQHIMIIYATANAVTHILFTISLLWMQQKPNST